MKKLFSKSFGNIGPLSLSSYFSRRIIALEEKSSFISELNARPLKLTIEIMT
jgi:hypothetical protein